MLTNFKNSFTIAHFAEIKKICNKSVTKDPTDVACNWVVGTYKKA